MRAVLIFLLLCVFSALQAVTAQPVSPKEKVEGTASRLLTIIESEWEAGGEDLGRVEAELNAVLGTALDFEAIAIGVIGQYRNGLSVAQRVRFQQVFQTSIIQLVAKALTALDAHELKVLDARMGGDTRAQVPMILTTAGGKTFEILFSLVARDADWRVRNLIVNGVNLGLTFRNQFHELMKANDGNADAVITAWAEVINEDPSAPNERLATVSSNPPS